MNILYMDALWIIAKGWLSTKTPPIVSLFVCVCIQPWSHFSSSVWFALAFCWSKNSVYYFYSLLQCYFWIYPALHTSLTSSLRGYCARSSADTRTFRVPHRRQKFQGQRACSYIGPVTWNSLPFAVRHAQTLPSFNSQLKTYIFCQSKWSGLSLTFWFFGLMWPSLLTERKEPIIYLPFHINYIYILLLWVWFA